MFGVGWGDHGREVNDGSDRVVQGNLALLVEVALAVHIALEIISDRYSLAVSAPEASILLALVSQQDARILGPVRETSNRLGLVELVRCNKVCPETPGTLGIEGKFLCF